MNQSNDNEPNNFSSFTSTDFIDIIKETMGLAKEIIQHSYSNKGINSKLDNLLKTQCCNTLNLLTKLNDQDHQSSKNNEQKINNNSNSKSLNTNLFNSRMAVIKSFDFTRPKLSDQQRFNKLIELDDALIDKSIFYIEQCKSLKYTLKDKPRNEASGTTKNPNLIHVQMNVDQNRNDTQIVIKDFKNPEVNENKNQIPHIESANKRKFEASKPSQSVKNITFMAASNVKRPQTLYNIRVDNSYSTPFIPKLTSKPNALRTLEESMKPIGFNPSSTTGLNRPTHYYPHPYQHEIENFKMPEEFFDINFASVELKKPPPIEQTRLVFINKRQDLVDLIQELKNYKEIAVDLEHHGFRTYQGLTCLLQISTDDTDYIIDVFPLWNHLELLNEIFTSPNIIKVFHSPDFDIIWLQRDLGLYVVNMFDTYIASKALSYPHLSYSALVNRFCQIQLNKRFQVADWRIRPIPDEMLKYARCDTHFLLYVYRRLRQELLVKSTNDSNLLRSVIKISQEKCLIRYEKEIKDPNSEVVNLLEDKNIRFNGNQQLALKCLFEWRDAIARQEDESPNYILPKISLLKICETLPRDQKSLFANCNPTPPLVRQYVNEILKIILSARSRNVLVDDNFKGLKSSRSFKSNISHMSIDLTDDQLLDSGPELKEDHYDEHHHQHHQTNQTPLLIWSSKTMKFIPNDEDKVQEENHMMEVDINQDDQMEQKTIITNMFASELTETRTAQKKKQNQLESKLFDGFITFYERYLLKIQSFKQEQQANQQN